MSGSLLVLHLFRLINLTKNFMSDFNDYVSITLERTNLPDGLIGDFTQWIACGESYEYILQSFNRTYYPVSEEDLAVVKRLA
jgi:hypothetical protein